METGRSVRNFVICRVPLFNSGCLNRNVPPPELFIFCGFLCSFEFNQAGASFRWSYDVIFNCPH